MDMTFEDTVSQLLASQKFWQWGIHLFDSETYEIEVYTSYDEDKLKSAISNLSCLDTSQMKAPEDAYLQYTDEEGLVIVPHVEGTKINKSTLVKMITEKVSLGETKADLDEMGVYLEPKVKSDDASLVSRYNLLKPYYDTVITYHFDDETEVLDASTFKDWMTEKGSTVTFDEDEIKAYVKGLAKKYNTAYSPKNFETSYGETVTITKGFYGWLINQTQEVEELTQALMDCESQDREPVYTQTAASHTGNDYGDTYVEINLSAQHLFFYKEGELLIETDFVSGNEAKGWSTPDGAYAITYKQKDAVLRGSNYATPVTYWMPFNGNIGLHDSTWRSNYGKAIFRTNGSHGCINLPPAAAEVIFENIEKGMPVLCYYLESTAYPYEPIETETTTDDEQEPELDDTTTVDTTQDTTVDTTQDTTTEIVTPDDNTIIYNMTILPPSDDGATDTTATTVGQ
jgi:lipoprotein-anchoring transpeptidase ErfK/SrfK